MWNLAFFRCHRYSYGTILLKRPKLEEYSKKIKEFCSAFAKVDVKMIEESRDHCLNGTLGWHRTLMWKWCRGGKLKITNEKISDVEFCGNSVHCDYLAELDYSNRETEKKDGFCPK